MYQGPRETFFDGLTRGRARVRQDFGVELRWIFDIPRRTVTLYPDLPLCDFITDVAISGRNDGVVALGLGEPRFERSRDHGLEGSDVHGWPRMAAADVTPSSPMPHGLIRPKWPDRAAG